MNRIALPVLLSALLFTGSSQTLYAATAVIATATNFKPAMSELIEEFMNSHPHNLQQINASSGVLFNQILHGAPFHAFFSADSRYPNLLANKKRALQSSRFTYAEGQLVVAFSSQQTPPQPLSATTVTTRLREHLLKGHKIAIANPTTAPYGIAAQQALSHLGLWQAHQSQWVRGTNVAQSYQYIASNNVAMGLTALSQVLVSKLDYWPVPKHWYQPIRQQAILLQSGQHNAAAIEFFAFIKTSRAKNIIRRHGYIVSSETLKPSAM